jgi:hypothetical protein
MLIVSIARRAPARIAALALLGAGVLWQGLAAAVELELRKIVDFHPPVIAAPSLPDQLPHSRVAHGARDLARAWLAAPTRRYRHAVLGDNLEAAELRAQTRSGRILVATLPDDCVFEDLVPRLVDLDADGRDEVVVVQSCQSTGAMITVWGEANGGLARRAAGGAIGTAHRWLNPIGFGDFNGDGRLEIAIVQTPHIGGIVKIYRLDGATLALVAERGHYSTHAPGSTELGLGQVFRLGRTDALLVPNQERDHLVVLALRDGRLGELARLPLGARLASGLAPVSPRAWRFRLADGRAAEVSIR